MILYVDSENKVRAVNSTTDTSLTELNINDEYNPFNGWSKAKICCYKVSVSDGIVTMMTPYIDSRNLEMIDNLGKQVDTIQSVAEGSEDAVCELSETTEQQIANLEQAICDLSEEVYGNG